MRGCVSGNNPRARSGRALGIPLRDHAADDQLDLVVDHHRQHDGTEAAAGEQHLGDRRRAMKVISGMAMPSSTAATTATASSESSGVLLHRPSVTASPNAEYTTSRIVA
ncbi:hypothetical protein G6F68_015707 [Rhizopus microsporus]|nr:hypothetical protein G6F68_015707 [Rhizopus microsporus]